MPFRSDWEIFHFHRIRLQTREDLIERQGTERATMERKVTLDLRKEKEVGDLEGGRKKEKGGGLLEKRERERGKSIYVDVENCSFGFSTQLEDPT